MDFRVKCAVQQLFSMLPHGRALNRLMQRHVTKSVPIPDSELELRRAAVAKHMANARAATGRAPSFAFEFGAGWDLSMAALVAQAGCRIVTCDLDRFAADDLVQNVLRRLGLKSLADAGVVYLAPCDARKTGLPSGLFDLVISHAVFEHLPPEDIPAILTECKRVLAPGGVCSFWIDYRDHWAYFDRSITAFNFLQFEEEEWKGLNPSLQYVNRLRHPDHVALLKAAGFEIVHVETTRAELPTHTPGFHVASPFSKHSRADLEILDAWFVLKAAR